MDINESGISIEDADLSFEELEEMERQEKERWAKLQASYSPEDRLKLFNARSLLTKEAVIEDVNLRIAEVAAQIEPVSGDQQRYLKAKRDFLQKFVEQIYTKFMNIVSDGRNMSVADVDSIAQGRVWTGTQGLEVGIVDEIGGIEDAIKYAACLALGEDVSGYKNLDDSQYKVAEFPKTKTQMELIMESFSGKEDASLRKVIEVLGLEKTVNAQELDNLIRELKGSNKAKAYEGKGLRQNTLRIPVQLLMILPGYRS